MSILFNIESLLDECRFEATRSSGKGGQNVNKVSTKVVLLYNVLESKVLSEEEKIIFTLKLSSRISKQGIFRISSGVERTQLGNKKIVIAKFFKLVEQAYTTEEERISTQLPPGKKLKRKEIKKAVSEKKASRRTKWDEEIGNSSF